MDDHSQFLRMNFQNLRKSAFVNPLHPRSNLNQSYNLDFQKDKKMKLCAAGRGTVFFLSKGSSQSRRLRQL